METEAQPVVRTPKDLPIWARLAFGKMIPEVYFFDGETRAVPRQPHEARVAGFYRTDDLIEIYYEMDWPDAVLGKTTHLYCWPVMKT